jgi:hypothetical protein
LCQLGISSDAELKDASSNRRAYQRHGFLDCGCCGERRLGDGRSVVVDWWPAAASAGPSLVTTTCGFTIETRAKKRQNRELHAAGPRTYDQKAD